MGQVRLPPPVLLIIAAFSRHDEALRWGEEKLSACFGPIARTSPDFAFDQTRYYESSMGAGLRKRFLIFQDLIAAEQLADIKLRTNELEQELAMSKSWPEPRPLNLDPGILTLGKFMRHLRGSHTALPRPRLSALAMDLCRLSPAGGACFSR